MKITIQPDFVQNRSSDYVIKASKKENGFHEELIVEKKSWSNFFERHIYSRKYTYDLSEIEPIITRTLAEHDQPSFLKPCIDLFNKKVDNYNKSWWIKLLHLQVKAVREVALPILSTQTSSSSLKQSSSNDHLMRAQTKLAEGDLVGAAESIEEYGRTKHGLLIEKEICSGFDIQDASIGEIWKGICTVKWYNGAILCISDGDDSDKLAGIDKSIEAIGDVLTLNSQGFLFFSQKDQTFAVFRHNSDGEVEMYHKESHRWIKGTNEALQALNIQPEDWCVCLGSPFTIQPAGVYHGTPTKESQRVNGHFYHEAQSSQTGSYCAIHAANAFIGEHALDIGKFYPFARKCIIDVLGLSDEGLYKIGQDTADVRKGADPATLLAYLKSLALSGKLPKEYASLSLHVVKSVRTGKIDQEGDGQQTKSVWLKEEIEKIPKNCDRILIGYGGFHFAALRKDMNNDKWYLIDSMEKESQDIAYDTLEKALKSKKAEIADQITLIY